MKLSLRTIVLLSLAGSLSGCEPASETPEHRKSKAASEKALVFHSETVETYCDYGMYAEACSLAAKGR